MTRNRSDATSSRTATKETDAIFLAGGEPAILDLSPDGDGYLAATCLVLTAAEVSHE